MPSYHLSLPVGTVLEKNKAGEWQLESPYLEETLSNLGPGGLEAMKRLCSVGATRDKLSDIVLDKEDAFGLAAFLFYLEKLSDAGFICLTLMNENKPLATLEPTSSYFQFDEEETDGSRPYRLSRFAYCRRDGDHFVAESPVAHARLRFHDIRGLTLFHAFARPLTTRLLPSECSLTEEIDARMVQLMRNAALLSEVDVCGNAEEDNRPALRQWAFHDLLFHVESRKGRRRKPFGGTFRFRGKIEPLPVVKPEDGAPKIDLYRPSLKGSRKHAPSFVEVVEKRVSTRDFGKKPLKVDQLGEFLFRTARLKTIISGGEQEASRRPYPNGGANYELELYLVVKRCKGLKQGLYHYRPESHQLSRRSGWTEDTEALARLASFSSGATNLQVLIIMAPRFRRVSWKYESMVYALILKNVGVLCQHMNLTATAMDLGGCILGAGDADRFSRAAGTDYLEECSAGEFLLGSKPTK